MSINREMGDYTLQLRLTATCNITGAEKYEWSNFGTIPVAIYKTNDMLNTQSVKYNESTHTGLTPKRDLKEGLTRLVDGDKIYDVISCNSKGRLSSLLLKRVDTNV